MVTVLGGTGDSEAVDEELEPAVLAELPLAMPFLAGLLTSAGADFTGEEVDATEDALWTGLVIPACMC